MARVVLLRGINVGGHRRLRPARLAAELRHLDVVNIGAAGTFVVRKPLGDAALGAAFARWLPPDTGIAICDSRQIVRLVDHACFEGLPPAPDIVRFVSVMARRSRAAPALPLSLPPGRNWLVRVLCREGRLVFGVYKRRMQTIGQLGALDDVFGTPMTTRSRQTVAAIAKVLQAPRAHAP